MAIVSKIAKANKISEKKTVRKTIESKLKAVVEEVHGKQEGKKLEKKIKKAGKILSSGFTKVKKNVLVPKKNAKVVKPIKAAKSKKK